IDRSTLSCCFHSSLYLVRLPPPTCTSFPYTTLFRSVEVPGGLCVVAVLVHGSLQGGGVDGAGGLVVDDDEPAVLLAVGHPVGSGAPPNSVLGVLPEQGLLGDPAAGGEQLAGGGVLADRVGHCGHLLVLLAEQRRLALVV